MSNTSSANLLSSSSDWVFKSRFSLATVSSKASSSGTIIRLSSNNLGLERISEIISFLAKDISLWAAIRVAFSIEMFSPPKYLVKISYCSAIVEAFLSSSTISAFSLPVLSLILLKSKVL